MLRKVAGVTANYFLQPIVSPTVSHASSVADSASFSSFSSFLSAKASDLDSIVKLDLLRNESPERIEEIWLTHHRDQPVLSAVIPSLTFSKLVERSAYCPSFVLPLPRGQGFETILTQAQQKNWLFTPLQQYKDMGEKALPSVVVSYYTELLESKKLVLMKGELQGSSISLEQAQLLVNQLQLFYLDDLKYKFMKQFNHEPNTFDFNQMISSVLS